MAVAVVYEPIGTWPGKLRTDAERRFHRFDVTWTRALDDLLYEADRLDADRVVIRTALDFDRRRKNGVPRIDRNPEHPGVVVVVVAPSLPGGRVSFQTDVFKGWGLGNLKGWQANVRAIALSMEALRAVDRYGVAQGRQYAGFRELGAGEGWTPEYVVPITLDEAGAELARLAGLDFLGPSVVPQIITDRTAYTKAKALAQKRCHPDAGGADADWLRLTEVVARLDAQYA